eukprot:gene58220-biopygen113375
MRASGKPTDGHQTVEGVMVVSDPDGVSVWDSAEWHASCIGQLDVNTVVVVAEAQEGLVRLMVPVIGWCAAYNEENGRPMFSQPDKEDAAEEQDEAIQAENEERTIDMADEAEIQMIRGRVAGKSSRDAPVLLERLQPGAQRCDSWGVGALARTGAPLGWIPLRLDPSSPVLLTARGRAVIVRGIDPELPWPEVIDFGWTCGQLEQMPRFGGDGHDDYAEHMIKQGGTMLGDRQIWCEWAQHVRRSTRGTPDVPPRQCHTMAQFTPEERSVLFKHWLGLHHEGLLGQLKRACDEYEEKAQRRRKLEENNQLKILRRARVVGVTTTGCAKYLDMLRLLCAEVVMVEEAAEVLESHLLAAVTEHTKHLVLIGDHQQLRPKVETFEMQKKNLDVSLMERLARVGVPYVTLDTQRRMRPEICEITKPLYEHAVDVRCHPLVESRPSSVDGITRNLFFIDHQHPEEMDADLRSPYNIFEVHFVVRLTQYLLQQGYKPPQITVLVPYTGQLFKIKRESADRMSGVRITAVDNFQGEENDIIILSLTRSNEEGKAGFLKMDNRACVALSRASVVSRMGAAARLGPELELRCATHVIMPVAAESRHLFQLPTGPTEIDHLWPGQFWVDPAYNHSAAACSEEHGGTGIQPKGDPA